MTEKNIMQTKLELFKAQTLEKQREILIHMLEPFKERSVVFAKTLEKVQSADSSTILVPIMERMLRISDNIAQKKKNDEVNKIEAWQQRLKSLHEQELNETEEDLDQLLEQELASIKDSQ